MKIEHVTKYTYEEKDLFVFMKDEGCYKRGDFIKLNHETAQGDWELTTKDIVLGLSLSAYGSDVWFTELLDSGAIVYIG